MPETSDDSRLLEHWAAMVRVTQGLVDTREDAEDCASTALLQLLERDGTVENDEAFLVTVAKRRAVDRTRSQARSRARDDRLAGLQPPGAPDIAEDIAARAEAAWVDQTAKAALSERAYRLLRLLADGHEIGDAAHAMGMTQRAAESLLLRARRTVRKAWAKTLAVLGGCLASLRRSGHAPAPAATLTAAAVLALGAPSLWTARAPGGVSGRGGFDAVTAQEARDTASTPPPLRSSANRAAVRVVAVPSRSPSPAPGRHQTTLAVVPLPMGGKAVVKKEGNHESPVDTLVHCAENLGVTSERIGC